MVTTDGWVTIGTKLDSTQLEKDLKATTKELDKYAKEEEKLLSQKKASEEKLRQLEKEQEVYIKLTEKAEEYKAKLQELEAKKSTFTKTDGTVSLSDIPQREAVVQQIDDIKIKQAEVNAEIAKSDTQNEKVLSKYNEESARLAEINSKIKENASGQELLKEKATQVTTELEKQQNLKGIQKSIAETSKGLEGIIKKVAKWGIALIGIRSAYSMLSRASSTLAQYDEQYAKDLEYLRYVLAQVLAPLIKGILNMVYTLLQYINYIANAWFGVNLFANASAKNMKGMAASAKEINKQLIGFDEANVLQDTSNSGTSGGISPSIDLSGIQGDVPEWIKWIGDNGELIAIIVAGIAASVLALKLGLEGIQALGIGIAIAGVVYTIQSFLKYLKDPSWENFGKILQGIAVIIIGVGIAIGNIPLILIGAIVLIVATIIKYWEEIREFFQGIIDWLKSQGDMIEERFGGFIWSIYNMIVNTIQIILNFFDAMFTNLKNIFNNFIQFFKNVFAGNWKGAWENIKNIAISAGTMIFEFFKALLSLLWEQVKMFINFWITGINYIIKGLNMLRIKIPDWVPGVGGQTWGVNIPQIPKLAVGGIVNMPGRGTPIGGALAGEAGAEGVIPLTDSQAMETLGEAIGRYITINASITNTMNGRVINRQLQKIQANQEFAYNT